jgi:glutamate synthase (NADPH/NADH) small chain
MSVKNKDIYRPVDQRRSDFQEVERALGRDEITEQAKRCMGCGIPFCHGSGCPLGNVIPDFNAAVVGGKDFLAYQILSETSFFPEFTSRLCPALCEGSCTHGIDDDSVRVRQVEKYIIETAFTNDWVKPIVPSMRNGKTVAVVGSGPAGLTVAEALNRKGFLVTVYEQNHKAGGLLRYGIPDFKLARGIIDRRLALMEEAGISFVLDTKIGCDISSDYLKRHYDAVVLAVGTPTARDLDVPGRNLKGIYLALDFLQSQNRRISGEDSDSSLTAKGKRVVVIGGGDTGSDCVGTSIRQGAKSVLQIEIMPEPPVERSPSTPWPDWPYLKRTSSSHKEGGDRQWSLCTKQFLGKAGRVSGVEVSKVTWAFSPLGKPLNFTDDKGAPEVLEADLVLIAMGFTNAPDKEIASGFKLQQSSAALMQSDPEKKVFVAGDCATGPSLIVRAMVDAKKVAEQIAQILV